MRFYLLLVSVLIALPHFSSAAVILQYHHVSDTTPKSTSISPELFVEHLDYLQKNNFDVVSLNTIIEALKSKKPIDKNWVAITFDDGYQNILENAHEALVQRNFPYTIFVNPYMVDIKAKYHLSWAELNEMAKHNVEISNHSFDHLQMVRFLNNETVAQWKKRISENILRAENRIFEMTGQANRVLAYPYGEFNTDVQNIMTELDFVGIGQHSGAIDIFNDLTRIPRYPASGIYAQLNSLKVKLKTLSFDITKLSTEHAWENNTQPILTLSVNVNDFNSNQLMCYVNGESMKLKWLDKNTFKVQSETPLRSGRSRYICTARSIKEPDYYYWFSQAWLILKEDGSWYEP